MPVLSLGRVFQLCISYEASFETQARIRYFQGLSILRAGGRRFEILGALKCLQTGRALLRKQFEGARRTGELFGSAPSCSGAVWGATRARVCQHGGLRSNSQVASELLGCTS